tara:strand:- start:66 stop:230 length:165 start_codon:yes stop_codon:yes gene_type:complete
VVLEEQNPILDLLTYLFQQHLEVVVDLVVVPEEEDQNLLRQQVLITKEMLDPEQ